MGERGGLSEADEIAPQGSRRGRRVWALAVLALALLPSLGTLHAPWIADDAAILARVGRDGPWADWTRAQFDLELVRFWRPLVSTTWALQEALTGIDVVPLRLFNLALHALAALLAFGCARRLGARPCAAFLAGAWVALFPEQGGTCTWLAGRTDLLGAVFLLACAQVALGPRALGSAPLAFLACASKEFGFLAPAWVFFLSLARSDPWRAALKRATPSAVAVSVAFLWRAWALGEIGGGYPADLPGLGAGLSGALRAVLGSGALSWLGLALGVGAGVGARSASLRGVGLAAVCLGLALVPLYPLLVGGALEPQNARLFYVAECAGALGLACAWLRPPRRGARLAASLVAIVLAGRLVLAWRDTKEWTTAARAGEGQVRAARAALTAADRCEKPVLFTGFAASYGGAYGLGWGLADRFRAPFPASPRPVWPWRLLFAQDARRERAPLVAERSVTAAGQALWPLDDAVRVAELALHGQDGSLALQLEVDERAFLAAEDRSPLLSVGPGPPGAALEALLFTELGYEPVPLPALQSDGTGTFSLMQLLARSNGVAAGAQVLAQAADLGATRAYLELRACDARGEVLAASRWIELRWSPELLRRSRAGR